MAATAHTPGMMSTQDVQALKEKANRYSTTKSHTQVIFNTSAIAINVTLWNKLRRTDRHYAAVVALIWMSVGLNVLVIILATYLSFQKPREEQEPPAGGSPGSGGTQRKPPQPDDEDIEAAAAGLASVKLSNGDEPSSHAAGQPGTSAAAAATQKATRSSAAAAAAAHKSYSGPGVSSLRLCGVEVLAQHRPSSWACCVVPCTGGKVSLVELESANTKAQMRFMSDLNNSLNQFVALLAVAIIILNVIITAIAT